MFANFITNTNIFGDQFEKVPEGSKAFKRTKLGRDEWRHEDFMYKKETALSNCQKHFEGLKKQFTAKAVINEPELLDENEDMMAFKHLSVQ